jgi:branched-chain amino acid aminotransferase
VSIDFGELTFSFTPTRTMFIARCELGDEWQPGELQPFQNLELSPAACVLNYGQGLFEGLKAYRADDGRILLFRPAMNAARLRAGCRRLSMPPVPEELFLSAVRDVVSENSDYIPPNNAGALYIRPLVFGSGAILGVAPAPEFAFLVYASPVGPYFKGGLTPIRLLVTRDFHRAAPKGTGGVKAIGNYAPGMLPSSHAKRKGFAEVVYLDAVEERYIEEVGAANFFALFGDTLVTPALSGSILSGVTRDSVLQLAAERFGLKVEERDVSIDEALGADELFCSGTAAVISPIGCINYEGQDHQFSGGEVGPHTRALYEALTAIQHGDAPDKFSWVVEV